MRKTFTLLIALLALTVSSWATVTQQQIGSFYYELDDETHTATLIKNPNASDEWTSYDVYSDLVISATVNDGVDDYTVTTIGESAFQNGGMPSLVIEEGVVNIADNAFWACSNLKKATLPSTVTSIGDYAFQHSGLTKITISATITPTLGDYVFEQSSPSLAHIYVPSANVSAYKGASGWSDHASIIEAAPITVEWNQAQVASVNVFASSGSEPESQTIDGITVTATAPLSGDYSQFSTYVDDVYHTSNTSISIYNIGTITFAPTSGKLKSIVIDCGYHDHSDLFVEGSGWSWNGGEYSGQLIWTSATAEGASSVVLACSGESFYFGSISSIEFIFAVEEAAPVDPTPAATTITWETTDLATINVEKGYNSTGQSQNIKNIIVTNNAVYTAGQYCHFNTANGQYNGEDWPDFSMSNGGSLTFAPAEGKLTRIVITCDEIYPSNLAAGSGWVWDGSSKLTWSDENGATSVVLAGDGSSTSFSSGPIRLIEFTLAADPDAQGDVKWDKSELEELGLLAYPGTGSTSKTIDGIVATATASENGDYCHFLYDSDNDKVTMTVSGNGTLTFAPETGRLTRIVIAGIVDLDNTNLPEESGWTSTANKLIWSGDASFSVDLANASVDHITYVAFTIDDSDPSDTRKVPDLKFNYNYITEATIVKDMYDELFEPGTYYLAQTDYRVYVYEDFYGDGHPHTKEPSELGLSMTYSVPNNDVITLTQTEGNGFAFTVNGLGDAVVTASTEGNAEYKPASATFTIHVVFGKAATKECVLAFTSGPNAGQLVPEDYKFELETGEEVPWMILREKDHPETVYAPSFSIWGSRKYYVASIQAETKLRALTAGDDVFRVRYARYEDGDMNGEYKEIEIPVHIKPTEIALTTSVDFTSDPSTNSSIANNATYDPTTQQVQIGEVISDEVVQAALTCYAFGHEGWDENLQNTISFELPQGNGSLTVNGSVQEGCVLKVKIRGEAGVHSFTPAQVAAGEATVHYNVPNQTAVVIYICSAGGSSAPKRAPAAKKDEPKAALTALSLTSTYPITANLDPDHAGVYYSTHYNETQKYQLPVGTEAYAATISGSDMILNKVADGGQVIPANTALILKSTSASVVLTPTDADAVTISVPNQLQGTDSEKAAPANCYVLSGHSTDYSVTGVGFYAFSGTIPAHKAYLVYSGPSLAPQHRMRFIFNNENATTGIDNANDAVKSEKRIENGQLVIIKNGVRYNAQGQIVK